MLHKAATSFSPFKLQHLHAHVRSALNLNIGSNINNANNVNVNWQSAQSSVNANAASSSGGAASSSSLGSSASSAGGSSAGAGAGSAKWHAGRSSYGSYSHGRNSNAPPANATAGASDGSGPSSGKTLNDEDDDVHKLRKGKQQQPRVQSWRKEHRGPLQAGRQRSSSLSSSSAVRRPMSSTGSSKPDEAAAAEEEASPSLPRSTPYAFTQAELEARYATRQAFATTRPAHPRPRPSSPLLITLPGSPLQLARPITTSARASLPATKAQTRPSTPTLSRSRSRSIRRNSTSAVEASTQVQDVPPEVLVAAKSQQQPDVDIASPVETQHAPSGEQRHIYIETYPPPLPASLADITEREFLNYVGATSTNQDVSRLRTFTKMYRSEPSIFTERRHAHLMAALSSLQAYADVSGEITELWSDFGKSNAMVPDKTAHSAIIDVLANRSLGTDRLLKNQQLRNNAARLGAAAEQWSKGLLYQLSAAGADAEQQKSDGMHAESSLAALKQQSDEDYASARKLLIGLGSEGRDLSVHSLKSLLAACSTWGDIDTALTCFGFVERRPPMQHRDREASLADAQCFKHLLLTYVKAGEMKGAKTVFEAFKRGKGRKSPRRQSVSLLDPPTTDHPSQQQQEFAPVDSEIHVWNAMIYGNIMLGEAPAGLELIEMMMAGPASSRGAVETKAAAEGKTTASAAPPAPDNATLLSLIQGFSESADLESAFRWASKIHSTPPPADLPQPPPRLEDTLNTIIAAASTSTDTDIARIQDAANQTPLLSGLGAHVRLLAGLLDSAAASAPAKPKEPSSPAASSAATASSSSPQSSFDLGSVFSDPTVRSQTLSVTPPPLSKNLVPETEVVPLDLILSMKLDDMYKTSMNPIEIYGIVKSSRRAGVHAYPDTLARLIERLAAVGAVKELEDLYLVAYNNLSSLPTQAEQTASWAYLEDRMLIAMAKLGELGKAAMHRDRLLQSGAAPSADSYAAMITSAKDTTDDATVALELFEEARRFGVVPNLFLFNILISKLSRARRTHAALSYFEQMKAIGLRPSAVTYGSVIAACCRTGDEKAATFLFDEMTRSKGYRPRVPPYNTMMQFFVQTQPNREKALSYFDAMLRARVMPTGHTYKLLLDAYGSIAPVDMASVDDVFARLVNDRNVQVTGVHWASLINAYGTVQKDVDRAIEIFDSIASHPSTAQGAGPASATPPLPDVICYEALFNALLANDRVDLIDKYREQMQQHFVRPTAYVYNTLIRAHAASGDIAKAREVFEGLSDPSSGVAATGNHAQGQGEAEGGEGTVYREPSTYETMIRCELALGEKDKAEVLLQRAVGRAFPAAIIAKMEKLVRGEAELGPLF